MTTVAARTKLQLKNILFATDFSHAADAVIPYATEITKHYGAKLFALHVRPAVISPLASPASWSTLTAAARIEDEKHKESLTTAFAGMNPEILIQEGEIWTEIAKAIEDHKIDLVVIGTRGRSGIGKFFLGSIAEEIFRNSPCPVLTVGPHASAGAVQAGRLRQILYATDFSPASSAASTYAISLAQEFQAGLTLLHVVAEREPGDLVSPEQVKEPEEHLLKALVGPEVQAACNPHYIVERGEAAEKILQVAQSWNADLIVLGVHPESGVPGAATHLPIATAHKVVTQASCPVLTIRA
jgi:nucleotide-binding universal stress UspA family protein